MPEYQEGQTATNPRTGQRVIFRGGQWVNAGTTAPTRPPTAPEVKDQLSRRDTARGAESVARQLSVVENLYNEHFKGVGPGSLLEYLPTQTRRQFDAAAEGMRPLLKPLVRKPGEGTWTDADQALLDSLIPAGSEMDAANEQRIANIRAMIDDARRNSGAQQQISPRIRRVR